MMNQSPSSLETPSLGRDLSPLPPPVEEDDYSVSSIPEVSLSESSRSKQESSVTSHSSRRSSKRISIHDIDKDQDFSNVTLDNDLTEINESLEQMDFTQKSSRRNYPQRATPSRENNSIRIASDISILSLGYTTQREDEIQVTEILETSYKRRWAMLFLYILMYFSNIVIIISFTILSDLMLTYYNVSGNIISLVHVIVFGMEIILLILAIPLIQRYGLRTSLRACAVLQIVGAWICFLGADKNRFWALMMGTIVSSFGLPILDASPTLLVSNWFVPNERTLAISLIGNLGFNLPVGLFSYFLPRWIHNGEDLNLFILVTAAGVTIVGILNLWIQQEYPSVPPSISAETEKEAFIPASKVILRIASFVLLIASWGIFYGGTRVFFINPDFVLINTKSLTPTELACIACGIGFVLSIIVGVTIDRLKNYKMILVFLTFLGCGSLLCMAIFISTSPESWVIILCCIYGLSTLASYPVAMELGVELTFPISEHFSAAILIISANVWSLIFHFLTYWESSITGLYSPSVSIVTLAIGAIIATFISFCIKPEYKRYFFERDARHQSVKIQEDYI